MSSHKERMKQKKKEASSATGRLKLSSAIQQGYKFVAYFEGEEDVVFYSSELDRILGSVKYEVLDGKQAVVDLYNKYQLNKLIDNALFFVDADYDDNGNIDRSRIYLTPCYSIENLCSTRYVLDRILLRERRYECDADEREDVLNDFSVMLELYLNIIKRYYGLLIYIAQAKPPLTEDFKKAIHGCKSSPSSLVDISHGYPSATHRLADIISLAKYELSLSDEDMVSCAEQFDSIDEPGFLHRGKNQIYFFSQYVSWLVRAWNSGNSSTERICIEKHVLKTKFKVEQGRDIRIFSRFVKMPDCFYQYVKARQGLIV